MRIPGKGRYSPLAEITPDNVGKLRRVWDIHTGDLPQSDFARGKYGAETTPLKIGNGLYLGTQKELRRRGGVRCGD